LEHLVAEKPEDIQLKFDGEPVRQLDGAPVDAVIASLQALQRMVYIIGMRSEGRHLSERLKPTAKVKREYSIICRAPKHGSHIQPFNVASLSGAFTPAAVLARETLLKTLKAFDSGDEAAVELALPNARERWFMAKAAQGLVPSEESGLEVTVRAGSKGPFNFKAERARPLLTMYNTMKPPEVDEEVLAGKLKAIDFTRTILTIKPSHDPAVRLDYPLQLEEWLKANVRKKLKFVGCPRINQKGDVSSFQTIDSVSELEPSLAPIEEFMMGNSTIKANRPLSIPVTVEWDERLFIFQDAAIGIDAYANAYNDLRQSILDELAVLWRNYAMAEDTELDLEAQAVKQALLSRFRVIVA
jgi:hypothetical protein